MHPTMPTKEIALEDFMGFGSIILEKEFYHWRFLVGILIVLAISVFPARADSLNFDNVPSDEQEFLPVEQAFAFSSRLESSELILEWTIAPNYYLYQDRIHVTTDQQAELPLTFDRAADIKNDPNFGQVKVFHDHLQVKVRFDSLKSVNVSYQGCSQAGLCYPVQAYKINASGQLDSAIAPPSTSAQTPAQTPKTLAPEKPLESAGGIANFLRTAGFWGIIGTFLVLGIGLSLTPCVLPMVPILSGIIAGQGQHLSARRGLLLAAAYVVGMSLSYALAGVAVGYFGASANISAWLQNPWVLSIFASIFVLLALAMFGFYELQLPSGIMNKLNGLNQSQQGGRLLGVAVMGVLSALVVSPCVSAPLAGALIYISTTGDALLGGLALFAMGLGMGVPLLMIGAGGGALVPRAGAWMLAVKSFFGVLLLAVALWMLSRFLPGTFMLVLWALLLLGCGVSLGAFERAEGARIAWRTLGIACVFWASLQLIGVATGATNPLQPLEKLGAVGLASTTSTQPQKTELAFAKVTTNAQLQTLLDQARSESKPVMIDYYADWCTACLEMAHTTFADTQVQAKAQRMMLIQADITLNTAESVALLKRFGLFAPPSLVFFNAQGEEQKSLGVMGYMDAQHLLERLNRIL